MKNDSIKRRKQNALLRFYTHFYVVAIALTERRLWYSLVIILVAARRIVTNMKNVKIICCVFLHFKNEAVARNWWALVLLNVLGSWGAEKSIGPRGKIKNWNAPGRPGNEKNAKTISG